MSNKSKSDFPRESLIDEKTTGIGRLAMIIGICRCLKINLKRGFLFKDNPLLLASRGRQNFGGEAGQARGSDQWNLTGRCPVVVSQFPGEADKEGWAAVEAFGAVHIFLSLLSVVGMQGVGTCRKERSQMKVWSRKSNG